MLLGHTRKDGDIRVEQSLREHSEEVARRCSASCSAVGLGSLGRLCGLAHDMGKADTTKVQPHLRGERKDGPNHASAGMRYIWETFGQNASSPAQRLAAQMIALAIGCHHSGRCDILSPDGTAQWLERMYSDQARELYEGSVRNFFAECASEQQFAALMAQAAEEINLIHKKLVGFNKPFQPDPKEATSFMHGLIQRFLFAALVDADWCDTARFMAGAPLPSASEESAVSAALWQELCDKTEDYIGQLAPRHKIDLLRQEISLQCLRAGQHSVPGIYRLYVPTGGGKTLAGLRYCVQAALRQNAQHIFYIAPYRSILSQNAKELRRVLGDSRHVLEHHSDVVVDVKDEEILQQTQRWQGVPVICTTLVQLLNTLYAAPRQNVRRMPALANSVLLLDEIQSLPLQDTAVMNLTLNLLAGVFGCTVVLCTATQPALEQTICPLQLAPQPDIVPDFEDKFAKLRRTVIIPLPSPAGSPQGYSSAALADFCLELLKDNDDLLIILNTKAAVNKLRACLRALLPPGAELYCLTTNLCPAHRSSVIDTIRSRLNLTGRGKLICVSTQLIEAGVDVSFSCVVRSLAALTSIAQAAGRCNRNGETAMRPVYVVRCADEDLSHLPDIEYGRRATEALLAALPAGADLLAPASIRRYYDFYYNDKDSDMRYALPPKAYEGSKKLYMLDLLSLNRESRAAAMERKLWLPVKADMAQAFATAEGSFEAIDSDSTPVLVRWGQGKQLISELLSTDKAHAGHLLRQLQHYAVALNPSMLRRLGQAQAIVPVLDGAALVLQEGFYDDTQGVRTDALPLDVLIR